LVSSANMEVSEKIVVWDEDHALKLLSEKCDQPWEGTFGSNSFKSFLRQHCGGDSGLFQELVSLYKNWPLSASTSVPRAVSRKLLSSKKYSELASIHSVCTYRTTLITRIKKFRKEIPTTINDMEIRHMFCIEQEGLKRYLVTALTLGTEYHLEELWKEAVTQAEQGTIHSFWGAFVCLIQPWMTSKR